MNHNEKYIKDIRFIEKTQKLLSRNIEFTAHFFAFAACAVTHVMYLVLFAMSGVKFMVCFNVFSVLFYIACVLLAMKVKDKTILIYLSLIEIVAHAAAATMCVGLGPNFCMFMLMIIPLAFLMPHKNTNAPFVVLFLSLPIYGTLNFYYNDSHNVPYSLEGTPYQLIFYVINIIVGAAVLIYVAVIYTYIHRYKECQLRVQTEQLRIMATTDPLTKLSNRRAINMKMSELFSRSDMTKYVIGICDIDDFKVVNDTYGHDMGDEVLAQVAGIISDGLPDNACASRWGGEEFLFIIPDAGLEEGRVNSDAIIDTLRKKEFKLGDRSFFVTMTIGICEGKPDDNVEKVIKVADDRLYKGKHNGKNHTQYGD